MTDFWKSGTGIELTGRPEDAWIKEFSIIPNGTSAPATITSFKLVEGSRKFDGEAFKEYHIVWKLTGGEFKGQEVTQKIKPFTGEPSSIDRNLNALKLLMTLCNYKPKHANAPTDQDLLPMVGKELGIKIREWQMPKQDGSGVLEGNFVGEVTALEGFVTETGIKAKPITPPSDPLYDTPYSRNPRVKTGQVDDLNDDIPF